MVHGESEAFALHVSIYACRLLSILVELLFSVRKIAEKKREGKKERGSYRDHLLLRGNSDTINKR